MSRVNTPILDDLARTALERTHKTSPNHALRLRCQVVLLKAAGRTSQDVGQVVGLCQVSVNSWVKRYGQQGIEGLKTKPGRGRKPLLSVAQDEAAIRAAVQTANASPWPRPRGKPSGPAAAQPWAATRFVLF